MKRRLQAFLLFLALLSLTFICTGAIDQIRFGMIYFYPPFVFSTKSGYMYGFDMDIARALCHQLNTKCTFTPLPLSALFQQLATNRVDAIIGAISITQARQSQFDFTQPYFRDTMIYVTLTESSINPDNLNGLKVGVIKNSTFSIYLDSKYGNNIVLKTFVTNEALFNALSNRLIDVLLIDTPTAQYWVNYSTGLFKIIGTPQFLPFGKGYGIAVRKGNAPLLDALNSGLTAITNNGLLEKLKATYFTK